MRAFVRTIPLLLAIAWSLLALGAVHAAASQPATAGSAPAAMVGSEPLPARTASQATDQGTSEQVAGEDSSNERTAWAVAAIAIFLGVTAIGFVLAVYGYTAGR